MSYIFPSIFVSGNVKVVFSGEQCNQILIQHVKTRPRHATPSAWQKLHYEALPWGVTEDVIVLIECPMRVKYQEQTGDDFE
jgi:hypothetical protein